MSPCRLRCHISGERRVDVLIVGAGIVGLATGLELVSRVPGLTVALVEKEAAVASHQSGHNSGVIHSGIYYKPGSLKATLCVTGAREMVRFCREHAIPHEICGKLIVATNADELPRLAGLFERGRANGLEGLRMLSAEQISEYEPHARGLAGVYVPGTGIVDYSAVSRTYADLIRARGGTIYLSSKVIGLQPGPREMHVETTQGPITAKLVINCAGLESDRVSRMAGAKLDLEIIPFRGEYFDLVRDRRHLLRGLLYPVPDPRFPFLGVHFTRRVGGGVEAGPNAVLALEREGYGKRSFNLADTARYCAFPGFWRLAGRHWRTALAEQYRSWSKASFVRALQRLMPELCAEDLEPGGSGVRAQALDRSGSLLDDFQFVYSDRMVHVCNVPSPAATASLAIGRSIVDHVVARYADTCPALAPRAEIPRVPDFLREAGRLQASSHG